mgnify:CR=1 FL=1
MGQQAGPDIKVDVHDIDEDDDEQRSLHENFEDSPRQRGDSSTVNMMHKRSS